MSFMDKLGNGVAEAGFTLSQKAKDFSEQGRIHEEITRNKNKKEECLKALGEACYRAQKEGVVMDFTAQINELDILEQALENLQKQYNVLKGIVICPKCQAEISAESLFCSSCGTKIEKEEKKVTCSSCGAQIEEGARFCVNCGTKVQ